MAANAPGAEPRPNGAVACVQAIGLRAATSATVSPPRGARLPIAREPQRAQGTDLMFAGRKRGATCGGWRLHRALNVTRGGRVVLTEQFRRSFEGRGALDAAAAEPISRSLTRPRSGPRCSSGQRVQAHGRRRRPPKGRRTDHTTWRLDRGAIELDAPHDCQAVGDRR